MQNDVLDRLIFLYEKLTKELGVSDVAFLCAVSKGIDKIREWYEFISQELFADSMDDVGLYNYCKLLGVDLSLSKDEKREQIVSALKIDTGVYEFGEFRAYLKTINSNLFCSVRNYIMKISGFSIDDIADLSKITKAVDLYLVPGVIAVFFNDGLTFEGWDNLDKTFKELDDLNCPFSMLDTI